MNTNNMNIRVYPIDEPKGSTLAYANIAIDDIAAIRGVRVIEGKKGLFVTMPQTQDRDGAYHDIAFPLSRDLRQEITDAVLAEFEKQLNLPPEERGYEKPEIEPNGRSIDVSINVKVFPLKEPKGDTLAFASVGFDEAIVIRGIRIRNSDKGLSVSMPQSKDKEGNFHDVAFPLSGDLRSKISKAVLGEYREQEAERKQGISEKLAEGKEESARLAAAAPARTAAAVAKRSPGLGD